MSEEYLCPHCSSDQLVVNKHVGPKFQFKCKGCGRFHTIEMLSSDVEKEIAKVARQRQKYMDTNRIERKAFREYARIDNAIEEYNKELNKVLLLHSFNKLIPEHKHTKGSSAGIFQLSDLHLNELVDLPANKYNYDIAARRLRLYVLHAKTFFKAFSVSDVLVALTGDLLNSDRRLDELLNQASNRARATFVAVDLIAAVLRDLATDFKIHVTSVSGNESRVKDEIGYSENLMTDNYDFTIFNILKKLYENSPIQFIKTNHVEQPVKVGDKTVLLVHGEYYSGDVEKKVIQTVGKWASRGVTIDFIIFGHLHYARIGDHFGRSASLVGMNDYSDKALQLITKASQNIHIIDPIGGLHSVKIDLQNTPETIEPYEYDREIAGNAYNPKSSSKLHQKKSIYEIII